MKPIPVIVMLVMLAVGLMAISPSKGAAQEETSTNLDHQLAYQRAVEAAIWAQPAISMVDYRNGVHAYGAKYNDALLWSQPMVPRHQALAVNSSAPYLITTHNLKGGPVVVEVPPASDRVHLLGTFFDAWFAPLCDLGPNGVDRGKGGKLLFLPPGFDGPVPRGYIAVRSHTYNIASLISVVRTGGGTLADTQRLAKQLRVYTLAQAAEPPRTRFIDGFPKPFNALPVYGGSFFQKLAQFVNEEPLFPRDKVMIGMLASLGIEPGKPFQPDVVLVRIFEKAVGDAWEIMQHRWLTAGLEPWYDDRQWKTFRVDKAKAADGTFETEHALWIDDRSTYFNFFAAPFPKNPETAPFYLATLTDAEGQRLDPSKTYRLHVPTYVPARDFWSAAVYSIKTKGFPPNSANRAGLGSYDRSRMRLNDDGSVDLYFGPKVPPRLRPNWIPTSEDYFIAFHLYGPERPLLDKTWKLPDLEPLE